MISADFVKIVKKRVNDRINESIAKFCLENNITEFYIGGGGLLEQFNDLDLFPTPESKDAFKMLVERTRDEAVFTKDFGSGHLVQFCGYEKGSLKELVESFDFGHTQVGARVIVSDIGNNLISWHVEEVFYTDAFVDAMLTEKTSYTGSEYPLGSLIRCAKVSKKRNLTNNESMELIVKCLRDVVVRGFSDFEDFKEQLKSVDVGYSGIGNREDLTDIYNALTRERNATTVGFVEKARKTLKGKK